VSAARDEAGRRRAEAAMWRDLTRFPGRYGRGVIDALAALGSAPAAAPEPSPLPVPESTTSLYPVIALLAGLLEAADYAGRRPKPWRHSPAGMERAA
jgi:hypothetical protein